MSSTSETGHSKNVANFNDLILHVNALGEKYNPSREAIMLAALDSVKTTANNSIIAVNEALPFYNTAVADRDLAFKPLSKLITRMMNALKSSGVSKKVYNAARTIARKIQGIRAAKIKNDETTPTEETEETKTVSTSQMSYDNRVDNFDKLIKLLAGISLYQPNEEDLKIEALQARHDNLKSLNDAVITTNVNVSNARITRNQILYTDITGLCDIAFDVKDYVKSVFGASSAQYKQISKIKFSKHKIQ